MKRVWLCRTAWRGFTLIEVMIAMALSALLMSTLFVMLFSTNVAWSNSEEALARTENLRIIQSFLRTRIEQIILVPDNTDLGATRGNASKALFEGNSSHMRFVAPLMTFVGYAGLYVQSISFRNKELFFEWQPYRLDTDILEGQKGKRGILKNVSNMQFSYYGANKGEDFESASWRSSWDLDNGSPLLIRLEFNYYDEPAPALIVPITW